MASADQGGTLVVGPSWVGDMVMAQSLFKTLKAQRPDEPVDVVAPAWSVPMVARMPEVRTAHALSAGHGQVKLAARRTLGQSLRRYHYDRAIVLPRSFKAALVPFHASVPTRIGYFGEWRFGVLTERRKLDKTRLATTVARYVALAHDDGVDDPPIPPPALQADPASTDALVERLQLDQSRPIVALLPGAEYGPAKQWPERSFAALARGLEQRGCSVWVLGSQKEHALGEAICGDSGARNLCGDTALVETVDLLHLATVAVSNDSGLMHVAAASGAYVVALYGSSSPKMTPPLTDRACIVQELQPCSPCFARTCRYGHYDCLTQIDVARVEGQVVAALDASAG